MGRPRNPEEDRRDLQDPRQTCCDRHSDVGEVKHPCHIPEATAVMSLHEMKCSGCVAESSERCKEECPPVHCIILCIVCDTTEY